jgi:hypothetical protein
MHLAYHIYTGGSMNYAYQIDEKDEKTQSIKVLNVPKKGRSNSSVFVSRARCRGVSDQLLPQSR